MQRLSRRELIRIGLGSAGGFVLAGRRGAASSYFTTSAGGRVSPAAPRKAPSSLVGGLQIGCMTWSFRDRTLLEALQEIVTIGFSSVELWSGHLDPFKVSDQELTTWRKKFDDAGVKITSYYVDFPEKASDEQMGRVFQAGRLLGVDTLSSTLSKAAALPVDKGCQKFKMHVGLHNEVYPKPEPDQIQFPADYVEVLGKCSTWMGITLDVGHLYASGHDPVQFIREHHGRIVSLHLKDEDRDPPHFTGFPFGKGHTPLIPILHALQALHFKRAANVEWGVQNVDPAKGVADALAYVRQALT